MPTIYQTFNVNSTTSMLLLNTTTLPNDNDIVVLLSNTNLPGRIVSVRDTTGNLSTTKRVVVSTIGGVSYLDGASSTTLNQPFAFITVANRDPSTWVLTNTFAFPAEESAASVESVSAKYIIASTIQAQNVFSTTSMTISSLNVENVVTTNDLAGRGNLYINTSTIVFENRGNAAFREGIWAGSSISTAVDLFVGRNISTLSSFTAGGNAFVGGFLSTLGSVTAGGNLTAAGNTVVSSLSSIGRIGFGSDVLMTAWNLRASTTNANIVVGSNSVSTTTLFANNAVLSNLSSYGPAIGFGSDVLMTQSQLRAASTLATNVVASNVLRAESTLTSSLTVYTQANLSSLSTSGIVGFGNDLYIVGSRLFSSDIRGSTMTMSNTLAAVSIITSTLVVLNFETVSSFSTTGGIVGFGNNVVMGGFTLTAGNINTSTLTASNAINTSTLNASSTFGLSITLASTMTLSGRTISTIRYEGGQAAISSFTGDGSLLFNLAAVSSLSLQSTIAGLGQIYTSAAGAGVNQTQLVSTNVGLGTLGYISSAAAISGSFITPQNAETGLSTQQLYVSDITLSNAITATYPSGNPPNPVALFDATGGGAVYMKMRSGAANELYYGVDGTGNAVIYSQWPGLQLQPLNMFGSLITANTAEFQVTLNGPNTTPFTQIKNTFVSSYQLYASSATIGKLIGDGAQLSNITVSTVLSVSRAVSSLHGVVSSGLSTVALFTSNTSNFFLPLTATNISSGFSTLAIFTSNTALGVSSLHGVVSSGLSTVSLFTSNTSNFFLPLTATNISSGFSTLAAFTSNTALGVSSLHGVVSSGLSTVALFTSNTSNFFAVLANTNISSGFSTLAAFTSNTALGVSSLHGVVSSGLSTVSLFTSNTSNFFLPLTNVNISSGFSTLGAFTSNTAAGVSSVNAFTTNTALGVSSLHGVVSSGLSTVALFTTNTSNFYLSLTRTDISTGLSTVNLAAGSYVSTLSTAIGTQVITSNLIASTMRSVVIQPGTSNRWVAVGRNIGDGGTNILYSLNGTTWIGGTTNNFTSYGTAVAYGNGLWVAVGKDSTANNTIKYSVDGITWSNITGGGGGFSSEGFDVKFNGSMWVAVGTDATQNNTIKYSMNGITWSNSSGTGFAGGQGTGVTWNGRIWVAGGLGTTTANWLKYSLDGITWSDANSIQDSGSAAIQGHKGTWDGKQWLWAVNVGGITTADYFKWSLDGSNWFSGQSFNNPHSFWNVNYNGFLYIYPGWGSSQNNTVAYSLTPLSNLQYVNTNFTGTVAWFSGAVWNGSFWVMGGRVNNTSQSNATLETSVTGITWTNTTGVGFTDEARGIAFTSNLPVYRQTNLDILEQNIPMSITSTNQILNAQSSMILNNTLRVDALGRVGINSNIPQFSLDVNGTTFLSTTQTTLLSTRQVLASSLGVNCNAPQYTLDVNGTSFLSTIQNVNVRPSVTNLWVAFGSAGSAAATIQYSTDGSNWSNSASGGFSGQGIAAAWNGRIWVAVGNGGSATANIKYSTDGINWSNSSSGGFTSIGYGVAWNGRMWVAVGASSSAAATIQYSTDGSNWTNSASGGFVTSGRGVAWNGSIWVANGEGGTALANLKYSVDGINWSNSLSGGFTTNGAAVAWNGRYWLALGNAGSTVSNIQYSTDGSNWSNIISSGFTTSANSAAWNGRMWVAVGLSGTSAPMIEYSTDGLVWTNAASGPFVTTGNGVSWNGRFFVAVGGSSGTATSNIKYSFDGTNWSNSASGAFSGYGSGVAYSSNLISAYSQENLDILPQNIPIFLRSTNTIFSQPSSIILNETVIIDRTWDRVGINSNIPQYTLDVNGTSFFSTVQTTLVSTIRIFGSSLGIGVTAPQYGLDMNEIARTSRYFLGDSVGNLAANTFKQLVVSDGTGLSTGIYFTKGNNNNFCGLNFMTTSNLTPISSLSLAAASGFVGMNCNSPAYQLDVNGKMRSRIIISNVTGTSLTNATSPAITSNTFGVYYNITNSGFNALTVPTLATTDDGSFWLLRNNTASALSITVTGAVSGIPPSPLSISASNSAIVSWTGAAFVMF